MGNFAENLNLGKHVLTPPPPGKMREFEKLLSPVMLVPGGKLYPFRYVQMHKKNENWPEKEPMNKNVRQLHKN